jgi:hypothetical protein
MHQGLQDWSSKVPSQVCGFRESNLMDQELVPHSLTCSIHAPYTSSSSLADCSVVFVNKGRNDSIMRIIPFPCVRCLFDILGKVVDCQILR